MFEFLNQVHTGMDLSQAGNSKVGITLSIVSAMKPAFALEAWINGILNRSLKNWSSLKLEAHKTNGITSSMEPEMKWTSPVPLRSRAGNGLLIEFIRIGMDQSQAGNSEACMNYCTDKVRHDTNHWIRSWKSMSFWIDVLRNCKSLKQEAHRTKGITVSI